MRRMPIRGDCGGRSSPLSSSTRGAADSPRVARRLVQQHVDQRACGEPQQQPARRRQQQRVVSSVEHLQKVSKVSFRPEFRGRPCGIPGSVSVPSSGRSSGVGSISRLILPGLMPIDPFRQTSWEGVAPSLFSRMSRVPGIPRCGPPAILLNPFGDVVPGPGDLHVGRAGWTSPSSRVVCPKTCPRHTPRLAPGARRR